MTNRTRQPARRSGAPAAALLGASRPATRPVATVPEPDFGPLPPMPSAPPPLPEGAKEGFDDLPDGAKAAKPLVIPEGEDMTPAQVPVDPTSGEEALVPKVDHASADPALKAELDAAARIAELEAEVAALRENAPMDLEGANDIGGLGPAGQVHPEDHRAAQARYRALRHQQLVNGEQPAAVEAAVEIETETPEEHQARVRAEAKAEYERRVAEMDPSEPVYVVGPRPPRPKIAGHTLAIGDVVPGAAYFTRLESWLSTGILLRKDR